MRSVLVTFPDGVRSVPAHVEEMPFSNIRSRRNLVPNTVPDPIDGYIFKQTLGGDWFACRI